MRRVLRLTVLVAALGYFVDMFDLTIFGVVRVASLKDLGLTDPAQITGYGVYLMNLQAAGMLLGGLIWGILGDKRGRLSVLFGSILLYSVANLLNAFVVNLDQYAVLRLLAGVGLAGELGAAVTLVSETLGAEERGYGTTVIAALGLLGAVAASMIGQFLNWKAAYFIGGLMGLCLLATRFKMSDSSLFAKSAKSAHGDQSHSPRGDLRLLLQGDRWLRYLCCVLVGVPIYFTTGILFTFAPELSAAIGLEGITAGDAILCGSIGLTMGDLLSGMLSQWLKSRKRAVYFSLVVGAALSLFYFSAAGVSKSFFYGICFLLGGSAGYWAVLVTIAAEQFGTNIRATVATSVPNFVRSSVIVLTLSFTALKAQIGTTAAAQTIAATVFAIALIATTRLNESFGTDLDFLEQHANSETVEPGMADGVVAENH
jgi:MFS transporter, putative metabolite:H+ symporter